MKFLDFFAGIGGFRLGMEMAGHECVGHCEIDKFAQASYTAMHNPKESEWFADDVTTVDPSELPEADCCCGGFPCQSFSVAGKRGGSRTHEALYFLKSCGWQKYETLNIFSLRTSKDFFPTMEDKLSEQSSQLWGNVGMMSNGRCLTAKILEFPKIEKECSLSDILEGEVDQKYFLSQKQAMQLLSNLLEEAKDTECMTRAE